MSAPVRVTQADREAAAKLARPIVLSLGGDLSSDFPKRAQEGVWDHHWLVQAFARHAHQAREDAIRQCLDALESLGDGGPGALAGAYDTACNDALAAVEALLAKEPQS